MKNILYTIILSFLFSSVCLADWESEFTDFQVGMDAYDAGEYAASIGDIATALKEYKAAAKKFKKHAEQGNAGAQYLLGSLYQSGLGVEQDEKEAFKWIRLAAVQGNAGAQEQLGAMYALGLDGNTQDFKEAMKWYRLAAAQRNIFAMFRIGSMYGDGKGVIKDNVIEYMWFIIGDIIRGMDLSNRKERAMEEGMTLEQIAEAEKLARECLKKNYMAPLKDCG